eukprot:UN13029
MEIFIWLQACFSNRKIHFCMLHMTHSPSNRNGSFRMALAQAATSNPFSVFHQQATEMPKLQKHQKPLQDAFNVPSSGSYRRVDDTSSCGLYWSYKWVIQQSSTDATWSNRTTSSYMAWSAA